MTFVLRTLTRARLFAPLAALALCAALAACGGSDADNGSNPTTPPAGGGTTPPGTVTPQMKCAP